MKNSFVYGAGGVVSADVAVPEHEREVAFYSSVLTTGQSPLWQKDLMNNLGFPIIGLGERTPEYESLPLQWMPHFQVADVAASAAAVVEMGGVEQLHAKGEDGQSKWACGTDPDGASFGLIPVVDAPEENGGPKEGEVGRISWLSLSVTDPAASQAFYQKVIGWTPVARDNGDVAGGHAYDMQLGNGEVAAEIVSAGGEEGVPPVWLIHVSVGDLQESLHRVQDGGGRVVKAGAKSAIFADPIGVYFGLQQGE